MPLSWLAFNFLDSVVDFLSHFSVVGFFLGVSQRPLSVRTYASEPVGPLRAIRLLLPWSGNGLGRHQKGCVVRNGKSAFR